MKNACITLAASLLLSPALAAAESAYKSASFAFNPQALLPAEASVTSPATRDTAVLYCQSEISKVGSAERTRCYDKDGNVDLVTHTQSAMATLAFSPAEIDGEKVAVRMSYRVAFSSAGGQAKVLLIPNLGSMQDRYGRDYVAPQERLDVADWYESYNKSSWVNGNIFLGEGAQSRVAATIDEKGKADIVRLVDTERAYERDAKIVKNALRKSRFIPGFVDGKAVPMGYLAAVHYGAERGNVAKSD